MVEYRYRKDVRYLLMAFHGVAMSRSRWPSHRIILFGLVAVTGLGAALAGAMKVAAAETATTRVPDFGTDARFAWQRKNNEAVLHGGVAFRPRERCYPGGVREFVIYALVAPFYFLQTTKQVTIINEGGPEIRRVYMDVPHSKHVTPSWYGESVGHYEGGDTLVVDTIDLSIKSYVDNYRTPYTDQLHVVERFRMSADHKSMADFITVDDPGAFTTQWSGIQRFNLEVRPLQESACAGNNQDFFHYEVVPLPQSGKPDF